MNNQLPKEYLGHICVRKHRRNGLIICAQGFAIALLGLVCLRSFGLKRMGHLLIVFGLFVIVGALLLLAAGHFFKVGYAHDEKLLIEIDAIGIHIPVRQQVVAATSR